MSETRDDFLDHAHHTGYRAEIYYDDEGEPNGVSLVFYEEKEVSDKLPAYPLRLDRGPAGMTAVDHMVVFRLAHALAELINLGYSMDDAHHVLACLPDDLLLVPPDGFSLHHVNLPEASLVAFWKIEGDVDYLMVAEDGFAEPASQKELDHFIEGDTEDDDDDE